MKDVVIICSVIPERFELLSRSLVTWKQSITASGLDCGIYLYIEGAPYYEAVKYIPQGVTSAIGGSEQLSGSHIKGYNYFCHIIEAKVYLFTHPEILFPSNTVRAAYEAAQPDTFASLKTFWLPQHMTEHLDDYPWQHPERLEHCEDIYKADPKEKGSYYWNTDIRAITEWQSTTSYAMEHDTLHKILPFPDFGSWGADDPWHLLTRKKLGIETVTIMEPILMHQWHPTLQTFSIEEIVQQAKDRFNTEPNL